MRADVAHACAHETSTKHIQDRLTLTLLAVPYLSEGLERSTAYLIESAQVFKSDKVDNRTNPNYFEHYCMLSVIN